MYHMPHATCDTLRAIQGMPNKSNQAVGDLERDVTSLLLLADAYESDHSSDPDKLIHTLERATDLHTRLLARLRREDDGDLATPAAMDVHRKRYSSIMSRTADWYLSEPEVDYEKVGNIFGVKLYIQGG